MEYLETINPDADFNCIFKNYNVEILDDTSNRKNTLECSTLTDTIGESDECQTDLLCNCYVHIDLTLEKTKTNCCWNLEKELEHQSPYKCGAHIFPNKLKIRTTCKLQHRHRIIQALLIVGLQDAEIEWHRNGCKGVKAKLYHLMDV